MRPTRMLFARQVRRILGIVACLFLAIVSTTRGSQNLTPGAKPQRGAGPQSEALIWVPDNATAWQHLPAAEKGAGARLPAWARALAPTLPWTTAAMLELDYLHRVKSPLDAMLRAKVRLAVARANVCAYAEAEAVADLRRAGLDDAGLAALADKLEGLADADREVLAFTQKLTLASQTITDDEVARLMKRFGDRQMVALVQHIAYANFQDRLLRALGLARHAEAPLPATEVRFTRPPLGANLARPRRKPSPIGLAPPPLLKQDREWVALDLETLRKEVENQKSRRPRIALPNEHDAVVHWGQVCRHYQPELASAWSFCMWAFGAESLQDPVIEVSVLWVVTRTQQSFY